MSRLSFLGKGDEVAKERHYELYVFEDYRDYYGDEPKTIGHVVDTVDGAVVAEVDYDRHDYARNLYQIRVAGWERPNGDEFAVIYVNDRYKRIAYELPAIFDGLIMHELGHFMCGHLRADYYPEGWTQEMIGSQRMEYVLRGEVQPVEAEADLFACREIGKHRMNQMLDFLISQRRERGDVGMELAIKEFQARKKRIKGLSWRDLE